MIPPARIPFAVLSLFLAVANYAQSGESIESSLSARRFDKIFSMMKPGDWLLLQFGHNDMKDRAPDSFATFNVPPSPQISTVKPDGN